MPVLLAVGDLDGAFCNPPSCTVSGNLFGEAGSFAPEACAEIKAIPQSGHVLNLHFRAPLTFATLLDWLDRRVGRNPNAAPPQPCRP